MSSKAAKRRREFEERKRKREHQELIKKDWRCHSCGRHCNGSLGIPLCLCGAVRKGFKL